MATTSRWISKKWLGADGELELVLKWWGLKWGSVNCWSSSLHTLYLWSWGSSFIQSTKSSKFFCRMPSANMTNVTPSWIHSVSVHFAECCTEGLIYPVTVEWHFHSPLQLPGKPGVQGSRFRNNAHHRTCSPKIHDVSLGACPKACFNRTKPQGKPLGCAFRRLPAAQAV